jgi:hypothetical protein
MTKARKADLCEEHGRFKRDYSSEGGVDVRTTIELSTETLLANRPEPIERRAWEVLQPPPPESGGREGS